MLTQKDIAAFDQVKTTVTALRTEYATVCANIAATEKHLAELPLAPVPLDDLKAAVLDFVDARGQAYLDEFVRPAIASFATSGMFGYSIDSGSYGKPLSFKYLEGAIAGGAGARSQLVTTFEKEQFNDVALYAFFGTLVKAGLAAAMATMTDVDFGYDNLKSDQIGSDRVTRRAAIQAAQDQLTTLRTSKATLSNNLRQLGVIVEG